MDQKIIFESKYKKKYEDYSVSKRLANALELPLPLQHEPVCLTEHQKVLLNRVDGQGNTLLFGAADNGEIGDIEFLIRYGADINHYNKSRQRAVDIIWELVDNDIKFYECLLLLLEGGSFFPEPFDAAYVMESDYAPPELKSFVNERLHLHEMIIKCEVNGIREFSSRSDLANYFNVTNESPVHTAAKYGTEEVLAALFNVPFPLPASKVHTSRSIIQALNKLYKGNTPLLVAATVGNKENVEFLVQCGADISYHNQDGKSAVDLAWDNKHYDSVLALLQADSHYPVGFELDYLNTDDKNAQKLKEFVGAIDKLHELIENSETEDVKTYLNTLRNPSSLYLNSRGESALYTTVKNPQKLQYKIYAYLKYKGLNFKNTEEEESLYNIDDKQKHKLKQIMIESFSQIPDAHISYIVSKSKPSEYRENFKTEVEKIYRKLNDIPQVSLLLQVIQYNDYVEVVFDFERDYVSQMDPQHGNTTKGTTDYKDGRIYIGFKMDTPEEESERLGTLAHELAHLAMQIVYQNNCNPYAKDEKDKESTFKEIVRNVKEKSAVDIIRSVFTAYKDESQWPSELIVRVPHILAKFGKEVGKEILREDVRDLYRFFNFSVVEDCEKLVEENYLVKPRNIIRQLNQYVGQIYAIEKANIEFENCQFPYSTFECSGISILLFSSHSTLLSCISIYQAINELPQCSLRGSALFLKINHFENLQEDIIYAFRSKACKVIIIDCYDILDEKLATQVLQSVRSILNKYKKVIFIASKEINGNLLHDIIKIQNLSSKCCKIEDKDFNLSDLCIGSQKKILSEKLLFQGKELTLNHLVDDKSKTVVNSEALVKIITERKLDVGDELRDLGDTECYYIERSFSIQHEISLSVLSDKSISDLFFVGGPDRKALPEDNKIYLSENCSTSEEEQFLNLCSRNPAINLHWLEFGCGKLFWVRSHGLIENILKYRLDLKPSQHSEDDILFQNSHNNVMIISDKTGMGKSTILTVLGKKIKEKFPFIWVIRIDLNNHLYEFRDLETKFWKSKASCYEKQNYLLISFLINELLKFRSKTEKCLFENRFKEGKVAFLFDGFDEISPVYKDIVIELLRELKKCHVHGLIVTTRPYMTSILEEKLSVFSCSLKSFDKGNQKTFLVKFWKKKFSISVTDGEALTQLEMYADRLIGVLSSLMSDKQFSFTGNPLQMRLVAEVFPEEKESSVDESISFYSSEMNVPEKLDMIQLYKLFIHKKYNVYKLEKLKHYTVAAEVLADQHFEIFVQNHQKLALLYLYTEKQCELLLSQKEVSELNKLINLINEGKEKTGIIDQVIANGEELKPNFVHRTFAEYFAAEFLSAALNEDQSEDFRMFILQEVLVNPAHEVLRIFLNSHFKNCQFQDDILGAFGDIIRFLCQLQWKSLCDGKGRTGLHIAVLEENIEIIKFYLGTVRNHGDILIQLLNTSDSNSYSPLHIAANTDNWEVVQMLIDSGANVSALDKEGASPLQHAAVVDAVGVARLLESKGADINATDNNGKTALQKSIEFGSWAVCQFLVEKGADIHALDQDKKSVVYSAAGRANFNIVKLLSDKGADVCAKDMEGVSPFHKAASVGDCETMEFLLNKGAEVNATDEFGRSALHRAAYASGNFEAVKVLVDRGADIHAVDRDGSTALHEAASVGERKMCKLLLNKGAVVNIRDNNGRSALQHAVRSGSLETVEFLVNRGAIVSETDKTGMGPLLEAAGKGDYDILNFVLEQSSCSVNTSDKNGQNALHKIISSGNLDAMNLLIRYGADVNAADVYGTQPIHEASSNVELEMLRILLDLGIDPNVETNSRQTALHMAAGYGRDKFINLLTDGEYEDCVIDNGNINDRPVMVLSVNEDAAANITDRFPESPMYFTTRDSRSIQVVRELIERGADVNAMDENLVQPLHEACRSGDWEVILLLLKNKADILARDSRGKSVLHMAANGCGSLETVQLLINYDAKIDAKDINGLEPLHEAANNEDWDVMELLLNAGADVNVRDKNGKSALHMAANGCDSAEAVKLLIDRGAEIDAKDINRVEPIHEAANNEDWKVTELLLNAGANINVRDKNGKSALHIAANGCGSLEVVHFLIVRGAEIDAKDLNGVEPIHEAANNENWDVMELLLNAGADVNVRDKNGKLALQMAANSCDSAEAVKLLIGRGTEISAKDINERSTNT